MILQTYFTALKLSRYERKNIRSVRKKTLNIQAGIVNIFQLSCPSLFEERPSLEQENAPSSSKNMPFLHVEDALLEAWKESSSKLFITYWFIAGYKLCFKKRYTPFKRMFSFMLCNDFLQIYQLSRSMDRLMGCKQGDTWQCNRVCSFSHRQTQGFTHK